MSERKKIIREKDCFLRFLRKLRKDCFPVLRLLGTFEEEVTVKVKGYDVGLGTAGANIREIERRWIVSKQNCDCLPHKFLTVITNSTKIFIPDIFSTVILPATQLFSSDTSHHRRSLQ